MGGFVCVLVIIAYCILHFIIFFPEGETKSKKPKIASVCDVLANASKLIWTFGLWLFCLTWLRDTRKLILTLSIEMREHYKKSDLGYVNSITFAVGALFSISAGYLMDKCGRKYAAVPGMILITIGYCFLLQNAYIAGIIMGIGNGICSGVKKTMGSDVAPSEYRAEFLGVYNTYSTVAKLIAPVA